MRHLMALLLLLLSSTAFGARVFLTDGSVVVGTIIQETEAGL